MRALIAAGLACLALALAACGGGPEGDVRETVKGFGDAARARDYTVICRRYLSRRIRERLDEQGSCAERIGQALGGRTVDRSFRLEVVSVKVDGNRARVRVRTSAAGRSGSADLELRKEDGDWHVAGLP